MVRKLNSLYFLAVFFAVIVMSCNDKYTDETVKEECPCDSINKIKINEKEVTYAYIGNSCLEFSKPYDSDTIDVTRRYSTGSIWHFQESISVNKDKIADLETALYCKIRDTANFYALTFVRNEIHFAREGTTSNELIGVDAILPNGDTLRSKNIHVLIPKEKFKGIIKLNKNMISSVQGERMKHWTSIFIEANAMIKYGDILGQYCTIKRLCK